MSALHVFDMDGTLLRGTTASREISRHLGHADELETLEHRFGAGDIRAADFAVGIHRLWSGLTDDDVAGIAARSPWIGGIDAVCADIAARGEHSMVLTLSPEFFARHLLEYGVDAVHGSVFPSLPFSAPVDPAGILEPADKVRLARAEADRLGLPDRACVAYGDSLSDGPLFAALEHTVAVNADPPLEAAARATWRGEDLRGAYALGRQLLDGP